MTGSTGFSGGPIQMAVFELGEDMTEPEIVVILSYLRQHGFAARLSPYLPNSIVIDLEGDNAGLPELWSLN
jgi:hypothetical protein